MFLATRKGQLRSALFVFTGIHIWHPLALPDLWRRDGREKKWHYKLL